VVRLTVVVEVVGGGVVTTSSLVHASKDAVAAANRTSRDNVFIFANIDFAPTPRSGSAGGSVGAFVGRSKAINRLPICPHFPFIFLSSDRPLLSFSLPSFQEMSRMPSSRL
jgi:hypothetical protein